MKRGDVVIVAAPADLGTPRPAVIVQSDMFNETLPTLVVSLITSSLVDAPLFRLTIEPDDRNGLERRSQIMIDKLVTLRPARIGKKIGALDSDTMLRVNRSLALWLGLGD